MLKTDTIYVDPKTSEHFYIVASITQQITIPFRDSYIVLSSFGDVPLIFPTEALEDLCEVSTEHLSFDRYIALRKEVEISHSKKNINRTLAKIYAIDAHNSVNHMYSKYRYSKHLYDVVQVFHKFSNLIPKEDYDTVESVLWHHDTQEDCGLTYNDILKLHNKTIADGVYAMTNLRGHDRDERANEEYYDLLKKTQYGEFYKLCDRIANVKNGLNNGGRMVEGYKKEYPHFKEQLKNDPQYNEMWEYLERLVSGKMEVL